MTNGWHPVTFLYILAHMLTKELTTILRGHFESHIFTRGKEYFLEGLVTSLTVSEVLPGEFFVSATVQGGHNYEVDLVFNSRSQVFEDFDCSCPYAQSDSCKHEVALGLAFIEHYDNIKNITPPEAQIDIEKIPSTIDITALLGRGDDSLSLADIEAVIKQLEVMKERKVFTRSIAEKPPQKTRSRDPEPRQRVHQPAFAQHYLAFSRWDGSLSLRHKNNPYQNASINNILTNSAKLTADEIELLEGLKLLTKTGTAIHTANLGRLLILADTLKIKVHDAHSWSHYNKASSLYTIALQTQKLTAELLFDGEFKNADHTEYPRFILRCNRLDFDYNNHSFYAGSHHLLRMYKNTIELYPMPTRLAKSICSMARQPGYPKNDTIDFVLSDDDTMHINEIITQATEALDLTRSCAPTYTLNAYANPKKILTVDFQHTEETLSIHACVDYGFITIDVADTVMVQKNYQQKNFKRRNGTNGRIDTHIFAFADTTINYAPIDETLEVQLFSDLYDKGILPNMKPRVTLKKHGKIFDFYQTYWPKLERHCQKINCEIRFLHDTFTYTNADFRADFTIDINTENDWLAFDTTCYLGDDKVTLSDIERLLKEGDEFFKQSGGHLMRITNSEELERFVTMLKRFSVREGRFEGRLFNAPELQYTVTSSPYYNSLQSKDFNTFCQAVQSGKPIKRISLPKSVRELLRPYQKAGVEWLYFLRSYHFAGILADDMGLGKTLQTLILLERERVVNTPSLVICPKTLLYNWQAEATKFTPKLKVMVVDGTPTEREASIKKAKDYDLLITGYATYKIDAPLYKKRKITFNYCVLDEAQFIKNHASKSAQIVKEVDARWRLALTGTPLENSVSELWSIFDFLMPGFLGTYKEFSKQFHTPIMKQGDVEKLLYLRKKVECFMLRRTKEEVLTELPPKIIQDSHCHLDAAQNLLYQEVLTRVKQDIFETVAEKGFEKSGIHILAGLTKLRQVCNHPNLLLKEKDHTKQSSAKLDMFHELISEVHEGKRKVLVFSQFTGMLDILAKELASKNIPYLYLSGKTRHRQLVVDTFNTDPNITVFLISLKAGGIGLNLTSADTVIIFDPWWNPSVERQAIDRAHRFGQKSSVNVYKLITKGTIEERIIALQHKKQGLFDALVGESKDIFKKLNWDDVQELFR